MRLFTFCLGRVAFNLYDEVLKDLTVGRNSKPCWLGRIPYYIYGDSGGAAVFVLHLFITTGLMRGRGVHIDHGCRSHDLPWTSHP